MLDWHRREEKATWWEYFRLNDSSVEDLVEERQALARLEFVGEVGETARSPVHRYSFPVQETDLRGGERLHMPGGVADWRTGVAGFPWGLRSTSRREEMRPVFIPVPSSRMTWSVPTPCRTPCAESVSTWRTVEWQEGDCTGRRVMC